MSMSVVKLWRFSLIGIWCLYVLSLFLVIRTALATDGLEAAARAGFDVFNNTFMVPVGAFTAVLLLVMLRRSKSEREAYRLDERRRMVANRSLIAGFWFLYIGNVLAFALPWSDAVGVAVAIGATIVGIGAVFFITAADELHLLMLEGKFAAGDD